PKLPRASLHRSTTPSTLPGVSQPLNRSRSLTQASRGPSATTSTLPSSMFRAQPVRPSSSALDRVHHRNPTPCTFPRTHAVSRTFSISPSSGDQDSTLTPPRFRISHDQGARPSRDQGFHPFAPPRLAPLTPPRLAPLTPPRL